MGVRRSHHLSKGKVEARVLVEMETKWAGGASCSRRLSKERAEAKVLVAIVVVIHNHRLSKEMAA